MRAVNTAADRGLYLEADNISIQQGDTTRIDLLG